jgi:hypothetical protein
MHDPESGSLEPELPVELAQEPAVRSDLFRSGILLIDLAADDTTERE